MKGQTAVLLGLLSLAACGPSREPPGPEAKSEPTSEVAVREVWKAQGPLAARPGSDVVATTLELELGRWLADATIEFEGETRQQGTVSCSCDCDVYLEAGFEGLHHCLGAYVRWPDVPLDWWPAYPTGSSKGCSGYVALRYDDGAAFLVRPEPDKLRVWSQRRDGAWVSAFWLPHQGRANAAPSWAWEASRRRAARPAGPAWNNYVYYDTPKPALPNGSVTAATEETTDGD